MKSSVPLSRTAVVDRYFIEHRAKLIDLAAYIDRVERAAPKPDDSNEQDFRHAALLRAITILIDGEPNRARRVLETFSDPTTEPIERAPMKGALGAFQHRS